MATMRQSRRVRSGDSLPPIDAFDPEQIPAAYRSVMNFGVAAPMPAEVQDMGGEGVRMPSRDMGGAGVRLRPSYIPAGKTYNPDGTETGFDASGVSGEGSSTKIDADNAAARGATMGANYPGLQSFSGRMGASKGEREASAFGSGRGRTRVVMGDGEVQFNEDDARRPDQLARQAFARSEEDREMKRRTADLIYAKQVADAQAAIGFTEKYGVPYDPETAKFTQAAEREAMMDRDFQAAMNALGARLVSGEYDENDYREAVRDLASQWGVRRNAPDGYFRSLQAAQGIDALIGQ